MLEPTELAWGKRYLMCPPDHFDVSYSINYWMEPSVTVDRDRAYEQWNGLARAIRVAGGKVDEVAAQPGLPDMVYTANAGLLDGTTWLPATMRHPERRGESGHVNNWFAGGGWDTVAPTTVPQEGAGDALPFRGSLVAGYGPRSELTAYAELVERTDWSIVPVLMRDPRFYHVDIAFCPLDEQSAMVVPAAFTGHDRRTLARLVPDPVLLEPEEGEMFCANSVVIGRTVIMPACTPRLGAVLQSRGFDVVVCDVSEFRKAGGGVRCLTLALDVELSSPGTGELRRIPAGDVGDRRRQVEGIRPS